MAKTRQQIDPIGHRMKTKYESVFASVVPQRTYIVVRIDGRSFHHYTKSSDKPFYAGIAQAMDEGALAICSEMMGCRLAYGQSDEYSFLATDFETVQSEPWFGGNVQKIASVSASIFTAAFNAARLKQKMDQGKTLDWPRTNNLISATFDSRVFIIPSRTEVENYFIWRQQDAARNSLNMLVSCHYSHKELMNASNSDRHELLHKVGVNWNDCPTDQKRGRVIRRRERPRHVTYIHKKTKLAVNEEILETFWELDREIPLFTKERNYLDGLIPVQD